MMHEIPELDAKGLREFAFVTGGVLAALFGLFFPWLLDASYPVWPWVIGSVLALWGAVAPLSLRPVYRGWMRFGMLLSRIVTPFVLAILFYAVFTPTSLIMKLIRRDSMARALDSASPTYRVPSRRPSKESMEKPF